VSALTVPTSYYYQIQSVEGIEAFTNLTWLDLSYSPLIERIELRNFPYLAYVDVVPANLLETLIITDNPMLTEINFTCVDCVNFLDDLDTLVCARNNLTSLDVASTGFSAGVPPLDYLDFSDNHISEYDFENCGVEYLDASGNDFTRMDIDIYNLETLIIDDNPLTYLRLYHTGLDTVIIENFPELDSLQVIGYIGYPDNRAKHMELHNLPALEYLDCSYNYFEQLTLADLPSLTEFTIDEMDMGLTLHNLPAITALDMDKLDYINSLTVSELDNMEEIRIDYIHHHQFTNLHITDMQKLSVLDLRLDITNFSITNAPQLDSVFFTSGYGYNTQANELIFADLPDLKMLDVIAETPDSTIHLANLPQLNRLKLAHGNISSLELHDLPALADVSLRCPDLWDFSIQNLPGLEVLDIATPLIHDFVLTGFPVKVFKYSSDMDTTGRTLMLGNLPQLDTLHLYGSIKELDISNLPHLRDLKLHDGRRLHSFTPANLPMLESLDIYNVNLDTLVIAGFPNLNRINVVYVNGTSYGFNEFSHFVMSDLPNLEYLSLRENGFIEGLPLQIAGFPNLRSIWLKQWMERLAMADLPRLENFTLERGIQADSLDFSGCPSISNIYFKDFFFPLGYMNLRNGNNITGSITTNKPVTNICVDDQSEADLVKTLDPDLANATYTTNCESNFCPVNRIRGTVMFDPDNNGCAGGVPCDNTMVTIEGGDTYTLFTDSAGRFEYVTQELNREFIITPHFNAGFYEADPQNSAVSFTSYGNIFDTVFCVTSDETHTDREIILSSGERTRPGFDFTCHADYTNNGTEVSDGVVNLFFNDAVMDVVTVEPPYDNYTPGCLSWNYTALSPFENRAVTVKFNLNTPEDNPPLNGGELLDFKTEIDAENDENPGDNISILRQTVVNSYDPNDKTCLEGEAINIEWVGDFVHYLIRFENKGTAEASFVRVKDIIDTLKFDISSFVILSTSHPCETRITGGNVIDFMFNNINLSHMPGLNDGFVSFRIRTRSNLQLNDVFSNRAYIYFDYNAPVATNECETVVLLNINTQGEKLPVSDVSVYPNPATDIIHITSKHPVEQVDIIDINGRLLKSHPHTTAIPVNGLKKGVYFIRVKQKGGVTVVKVIIG